MHDSVLSLLFVNEYVDAQKLLRQAMMKLLLVSIMKLKHQKRKERKSKSEKHKDRFIFSTFFTA